MIMKMSNLVGERFKEKPADCVVESHALMVRGGYIKYVANGIYSSLAPLRRITRKIEDIIRKEMDSIDGQEVQFPVVLPAALWQESGRYDSIGHELLRLEDRNKTNLVLGMTHEEAAVQLTREYGGSYTRYPFMVYQIQTKFRDEARPRAGLIRVREFTMKDAYSFHTSEQDLDRYYYKCLKAYERIFAAVGLPEVVAVASDSGMMGGSISHEFMLLTGAGEDSIALCDCGYRANVEAAKCITEKHRDALTQPMELIHTPGASTIEELSAVTGVPKNKICKAVVYRKESGGLAVVFIRGDLEANEAKIKNFLGCGISPADLTDEAGLCAGFIGPYQSADRQDAEIEMLFDCSLEGENNLICGGNIPDYHYQFLDMSRDVEGEYHDFAKISEGGICPGCGKNTIAISRGIEVGNIFQLGTKYTESMDMTYVDKDGNNKNPVMGCYGIGVGRLAASICEARHDAFGPIWPMAVAPWQVHICVLRADDPEVKKTGDMIYNALLGAGVEVLYDDRIISAGNMFSEADLMGVPVRVIISPRNLKEGCCEITLRDKSFSSKVPLESAEKEILKIMKRMLQNSCAI